MNGTLTIHGELATLSELAKKIDEWFPQVLSLESQPDAWGGWTVDTMTVLLGRLHPWQLLLTSFMALGAGRRTDSEVRSRFALGNSGLKGQTGAVTKQIAKMVTEGLIPADASHLVKVESGMFVTPEELVPIIRAALSKPGLEGALVEARASQRLDER